MIALCLLEIFMCKSNYGTCAFCDTQNVQLKKSHLIPKFVYDWVKTTAPTPYLRSNKNVEKREQDGPKLNLLCENCENLFSKWEDYLSKELFKRIANYNSKSYILKLSKESLLAILSIFWRKLVTINYSEDNTWTKEDKERILLFSSKLKNELASLNIETNVYLIPITTALTENLERYSRYNLERAIDNFNIRFLDNPHRFISHFKFPFMYFYVTSTGWSEVEIDGGILLNDLNILFSEDRSYVPNIMLELINKSLEQYHQMLGSISDSERNKIEESIRNNKNFEKTGAYKSLYGNSPKIYKGT